MDNTPSLKEEIDYMLEKCKLIYECDDTIGRFYDMLRSLRQRQIDNDEKISKIESEACEKIAKRNRLVQMKTELSLIIDAKGYISNLRNSLHWIYEKYPETRTMILDNVLQFIDDKKIEIARDIEIAKLGIRGVLPITKKYDILLTRRDHLHKRIIETEHCINVAIKQSLEYRRNINIILDLQQTKQKLEDSVLELEMKKKSLM